MRAPVTIPETRARFGAINLLRPILSLIPVSLAVDAGADLLALVLTGFIVGAVAWFVVATWKLSTESLAGYLSFVPTFLDISFVTSFAFFTGGGLSTSVVAYVYVTAVCAMNTRVNQGLFAALLISVSFGGMNVLIWLGWLEPLNVLGPVRELTGRETWGVSVLVAAINLAVYSLVHRLVHSLEGKNQALEAQSEELQEANRSLARAQRQFKADLAVARRIQEALNAEDLPQGHGFRLEARTISLEEVGGDLLECSLTTSGDPAILVADAAGHGVPAALIASMIKIAADRSRALADQPAAFLNSINDALHERTNLHFVAATYACYERATRTLRFALAGNPPVFLLRPRAGARQVDGRGGVLGIMADPKLEERRVPLEPGDRVVIFTDGINECRNSSGEELTNEQLEVLLTGVSSLTRGENTAARIVDELARFTAGRGFEDDVTLVVLTAE